MLFLRVVDQVLIFVSKDTASGLMKFTAGVGQVLQGADVAEITDVGGCLSICSWHRRWKWGQCFWTWCINVRIWCSILLGMYSWDVPWGKSRDISGFTFGGGDGEGVVVYSASSCLSLFSDYVMMRRSLASIYYSISVAIKMAFLCQKALLKKLFVQHLAVE